MTVQGPAQGRVSYWSNKVTQDFIQSGLETIQGWLSSYSVNIVKLSFIVNPAEQQSEDINCISYAIAALPIAFSQMLTWIQPLATITGVRKHMLCPVVLKFLF